MEEGARQGEFYHSNVIPAAEARRAPVDELENDRGCKEMWPMPSYGDLMFDV